ncbi:MAG: hypothetical protein KIH69_017085 [Anaerolineae bacterium]|nr:hypothetical protein [Anaerolineae bacterium]
MAITLENEQLLVNELQEKLRQHHFVSLAKAARQVKVPISRLTIAIQMGEIPALELQPQKWMVRLEAVQLYFNTQPATKPHSTDEIDALLIKTGLIAKRSLPFAISSQTSAINFGAGLSGTDLIIEGRNRF